MQHYRHAIQFISTIKNQAALTELMPTHTIKKNEHTADLYQAFTPRALGTIVLFHGLNAIGPHDKRLLRLTYAFNRVGFDVLIPHISSLSEIRLTRVAEIDAMGTFLQDLGFKNMKFFGASFTTPLMVKIARMPCLKPTIQSMLIVSPYFATKITDLSNQLESPHMDVYGQFAALKIALSHQASDPDYQKALSILTCASHEKAVPYNEQDWQTQYEQFEPRIANDIRHWMRGFSTQKNFLLETFPDAINALWHSSDFADDLIDLNASIHIIHAIKDTVFPPTNSTRLSDYLHRHKVKHRLLLTHLLDHATITWKNSLKEILPMINIFAHYLKV